MSADTLDMAALRIDGPQDAFAAVPDEVLALVLAHLDAAGLVRASVVSRRWRRIATADGSWRHAAARNLGRLPFERLFSTWRQELTQRQALRRAWRRGQRRLCMRALTGSVDHVVMPGSTTFVLAFSGGPVMCTQLDKQSGRLVGRIGPLGGRGTAVAGSASLGVWGLQDGRCVCALMTPGGKLGRVVWMKLAGHVPVLCVAGSRDAVGQRSMGDGRGYGCVAAGDARGVVRLWEAEAGEPRGVLRAPGEPPLLRVAWAHGGRWVAAMSATALFVWRVGGEGFRHVALPQPAPAAPLLLAGDPHAPAFFLATPHGAWRLPCTGPLEQYSGSHATALSSASVDLHHASDQAARLLCLGDALGGVTVLLADAPGGKPVHRWARVHGTAVAAVGAGATAVVSAGRDGHVAVHDVLAGDRLAAMWARAGGRGAAHVPWTRAVLADLHRTAHVRCAVVAGQLMARRSPAQWAAAAAAGGGWDVEVAGHWDEQDEGEEEGEVPFDSAAQAAAGMAGDGVAGFHAWAQGPVHHVVGRYPSLVGHVAVGSSGVCVANATHVLVSSAAPTVPVPPASSSSSAGRGRKPLVPRRETREVREEVERVRGEEAWRRQGRVRRAEARERVEREYVGPLGLDEHEQVEYAVWLSAQPPDAMTEDEQLAYALRLSRDEQ